MRSDRDAVECARSLMVGYLLCLALSGCSTPPRVSQSLVEGHKGNDVDAQMSFWHELTDKPLTSNDEAFHGLLLYVDGRDDARDYPGRVAELKSRKMLPETFSEPATVAVSRGTLAVAILRVADIKGGVTTRVFGPRPRYAVRELVFSGLYPPSSPNQTFSGAEFVGIIGRLEDYQRGNAADVPAAVLPGEAESQAN